MHIHWSRKNTQRWRCMYTRRREGKREKEKKENWWLQTSGFAGRGQASRFSASHPRHTSPNQPGPLSVRPTRRVDLWPPRRPRNGTRRRPFWPAARQIQTSAAWKNTERFEKSEKERERQSVEPSLRTHVKWRHHSFHQEKCSGILLFNLWSKKDTSQIWELVLSYRCVA